MKYREIEFIILVALLMALVSVSINMLLPAFQDISNDFQLKDKNKIQLCISLLYFGLGVSQLFYGSLSDTIGRKQTIYIGLVIFILGCSVSYLSSKLFTLLLGQTLQGLGLGAPRVITVAIVRDKFEGRQMARAMSFIMMIYVLMPTVSPILGKAITLIFGWRILYIVYIIFGVFVFFIFKYRMHETLKKNYRTKFSLELIFQTIKEVVTSKNSIGHTIILGLYSGVFITYLNLSQTIFEFQYQLKNKYPIYFAFLALGIAFASFINGKLVIHLGMRQLTKLAITISLSTAILISFISYFNTLPLWLFLIFMFIQLFSYGILIGNLSALAMLYLGHIAGVGAAIIGAVSTLISVPLSILLGSHYNNSTMPIIVGSLVVGILSIIILNFLNQKSHEKLNN